MLLPVFPGRDQSRPEPLEQTELSSFFSPGISAGALCKKAGGSTKRLSAHAAALPVSASFREDQEDRRLWNLACDIAVEQIISRERIPILETGGDAKKIREKVFHILGDRSDSAEKICRKLKEQAFPFHLEELEEAFHFDDHTLWDTCTGEKGKRTKEKWNKLLSYTAANRQDHRKRRGSQKGDQKEEAGTVRSGRYDYKKFLRQFSVLREEVELDTESFDYIFYNYGMEHYGNLPLIEPLEYKEVNRLEELVIAIDTSGSCDGETVRRFLGETYSILSEKENFSINEGVSDPV